MRGAAGVTVPETPRFLSLVRFRHDDLPAEYLSKYPFVRDRACVFIGEIPNMPGHCVVAGHVTGQIHSGYHTENFREIPEDEA